MKIFINRSSVIASVLFLLFITITTTSCKKEKKTVGKVTVNKANGTPVIGATVNLAAPSANGVTEYTEKTIESGLAEFEIPLPAIWDVSVTYYDTLYLPNTGVLDTTAAFSSTVDSVITLYGTGVLRLDEPGKTESVVVVVRDSGI